MFNLFTAFLAALPPTTALLAALIHKSICLLTPSHKRGMWAVYAVYNGGARLIASCTIGVAHGRPTAGVLRDQLLPALRGHSRLVVRSYSPGGTGAPTNLSIHRSGGTSGVRGL